jgi:hypothetical protein
MLLRGCGIGGPDYNDCFRGSAVTPIVELPLGWASHSEGDNALGLGVASHAEGYGEDVDTITAVYIGTGMIGVGDDINFISPGDIIIHEGDKKWATISRVDYGSGTIYAEHDFSTNFPVDLLIYKGVATGGYSHAEGSLCAAAG